MMKDVKKLLAELKAAGLEVTITRGKNHVRVFNPDTRKVVFFGGQSLGDRCAAKNIQRDLKIVGFNGEVNS